MSIGIFSVIRRSVADFFQGRNSTGRAIRELFSDLVKFAVNIRVSVPVVIVLSLTIYIGSQPEPKSSGPLINPNPPHPGPAVCPPGICVKGRIKDRDGKGAMAYFYVLGQDSYWKINKMDTVVVPGRGMIKIEEAFDAIFASGAFEKADHVIAVGMSSAGIRKSSEDEEALAAGRASALLGVVRPRLGGIPLSTLNLGRYQGDKDHDSQRPPLIVCVSEMDPGGVRLDEALMNRFRREPLFHLDIDNFSLANSPEFRKSAS